MRDRSPDGVGSEAGEAATPAFAADDGPDPHRLWQVSRVQIEGHLHILVCGRDENLQKDMVGLDGP